LFQIIPVKSTNINDGTSATTTNVALENVRNGELVETNASDAAHQSLDRQIETIERQQPHNQPIKPSLTPANSLANIESLPSSTDALESSSKQPLDPIHSAVVDSDDWDEPSPQNQQSNDDALLSNALKSTQQRIAESLASTQVPVRSELTSSDYTAFVEDAADTTTSPRSVKDEQQAAKLERLEQVWSDGMEQEDLSPRSELLMEKLNLLEKSWKTVVVQPLDKRSGDASAADETLSDAFAQEFLQTSASNEEVEMLVEETPPT
jgi:hypothetical protein